MPLTLTWQQIALRILLALVASFLIGYDRDEHGKTAGIRTTMLVCLAATLAMLQANLLLNTTGKAASSFISTGCHAPAPWQYSPASALSVPEPSSAGTASFTVSPQPPPSGSSPFSAFSSEEANYASPSPAPPSLCFILSATQNARTPHAKTTQRYPMRQADQTRKELHSHSKRQNFTISSTAQDSPSQTGQPSTLVPPWALSPANSAGIAKKQPNLPLLPSSAN